jgi:hypothetical protein
MARNHALANLVKLFAVETGLSLRGAQHNAQHNTQKWQAFVTTHAAQSMNPRAAPSRENALALVTVLESATAEKQPEKNFENPNVQSGTTCHPPTALLKAESDRTAEEQMVVDTWLMLQQVIRYARAAAEPMESTGHAVKATELLKAYHTAQREMIRVQTITRQLVPIGEFIAFKASIQRLANLIQSIRDIASSLNPANPLHAKAELDRFLLHRFAPAVESIEFEVDDIAASAGLAIVPVAEIQRLRALDLAAVAA